MLPWSRALTDFDINRLISKTSLSSLFQGVFSRDEILKRQFSFLPIECGIINLDLESGIGTHWTAYFKTKNRVYYYDSFGNLQPPKEFISLFDKYEIFYNRNRDQEFNSVICGQLSLCFLFKCYLDYIKEI